jgi:hypothetical protein
MIVFLVLALWIAPVAVGIYIGNKRGKFAAGLLLPLFLGWIGVAIVACLSDRSTNVSVNISNNISNRNELPKE